MAWFMDWCGLGVTARWKASWMHIMALGRGHMMIVMHVVIVVVITTPWVALIGATHSIGFPTSRIGFEVRNHFLQGRY